MLKTFPIEFIRQAIEQTLDTAHNDNVNLFGGKEQIKITSFYEQLKNQDEVDRFVETYRDIADQQNRTGLIGNGVILSPENPTITNLYSSLIIPFSWTCSIRCTLANRDQMLNTINNLISELKGRKCDIAQLDCIDENGHPYSTPFIVGTIGENDGAPALQNGDYLGTIEDTADIETIIDNLNANNVIVPETLGSWFYATNDEGKLKVFVLTEDGLVAKEDDGTYDDIIFPPEHTSFEKFKLSMSFDSLRCDEPRTLNSEEYCEISFGGSATLVNESLQLGNDLLKIKFSKNKIIASPDIIYNTNVEYLEPLELPSGNNVNTQINQLVSNNFKSNSHADSISITLQYTFMVDFSSDLIKNWFNYARYGTHTTALTGVSPNTIYEISEIWSSWGQITINTFKAKIIENIDIENTESDALTISTTFQVQGDNN